MTTNELIFDFPGHISSWSLSEVMDEAATRVIVTNGEDKARQARRTTPDRQAARRTDSPVPDRSKQGWRLYDQIATYDIAKKRTVKLRDRADTSAAAVPRPRGRSRSATSPRPADPATSAPRTGPPPVTVTLYHDPTTTFPEFELGDWVTFAIDDPFYGGKMYLRPPDHRLHRDRGPRP